jgi:xylan 1,4-beta-xylosidase
MKIVNPVLTGFHGDPSIVRVKDTYYIASSTFEWFPGVRIHESKDLAHWNLATSVLDRTELLDMYGNPCSGGIWAPDLTCADGMFWLVYTDVKVVEGAFKDMYNYLTVADDIKGPWSAPIKLNGVGFDASLFHDDDGKKYLIQQTWDHREYNNAFKGLTLTEYDAENKRLKPETAQIIYRGTDVKTVEGPHIYKIGGFYYIFAAQGCTIWTHQEIAARSKTLFGPYETEPDGPFITNFDTPDHYLQKQGHGSLVETPSGEWYYASLCARPLHHPTENIYDPRGWCTLGRETSIQKVYWDEGGWPRIVGGHGGLREADAPADAKETPSPATNAVFDDFKSDKLDGEWNTLRVPFSDKIGTVGGGKLELIGQGSLSNRFNLSLIARRWKDFRFEAITKVKFSPCNYQAMAGLANYYNNEHWSWIFITKDDEGNNVIEVAECDNKKHSSVLKENAVKIPAQVEWVWLKSVVDRLDYFYEYSFDGKLWNRIPVKLDAKVLSDDYVCSHYGGFFTGAFVGLAAVDYSGYGSTASFEFFEYKVL